MSDPPPGGKERVEKGQEGKGVKERLLLEARGAVHDDGQTELVEKGMEGSGEREPQQVCGSTALSSWQGGRPQQAC